MAVPVTQERRYTEAQYLELKRQAAFKKYTEGELFIMVGASAERSLTVTNCVAESRQQLKGKPCKVYANATRVHIQKTWRYTYPDVVIVCGKADFEDKRDTLPNPAFILEVLSASTEAYDRGDKFRTFRTLLSLQVCLSRGTNQTPRCLSVRKSGGYLAKRQD